MSIEPTDRTFAELERVIEHGRQTFVDVGQALLEIRERRLYREQYPTFEEYCRARWGWSRQHSYWLMGASEIVTQMSDASDIRALPTSQQQVRELARLPDPSDRAVVWTQVVEQHGPEAPARIVREIVQQHHITPVQQQAVAVVMTEAAPQLERFDRLSHLRRAVSSARTFLYLDPETYIDDLDNGERLSLSGDVRDMQNRCERWQKALSESKRIHIVEGMAR